MYGSVVDAVRDNENEQHEDADPYLQVGHDGIFDADSGTEFDTSDID